MSQYTQRSVWWLVTAYGDNILRLEDAKSYPKCIKAVHGGREQCPDTGREHFQGAIECHGQQRATFFRDWTPGIHFEVAKSKEACRKYAMKDDTAIGEKLVRSNPTEYKKMEDLLLDLAKQWHETRQLWRHKIEINHRLTEEDEYWFLVKRIISNSPNLISSYTIPAVYKAWKHTAEVWLEMALSITEPAPSCELSSQIISDSGINNASPSHPSVPPSDEQEETPVWQETLGS